MRAPRGGDEAGQGGLVMLALVLVIIGVGMTIQLSVDLTSSPSDSAATGADGSPLVAPAADLQAKQTLSSAMTAVQAALAGGNQVAAIDLDARVPGVAFSGEPSTGPTAVSLAVAAGLPSTSGTGLTEDVTLAVRSDSGTCWYIWLGGAVPWFGARTDQHECTAPAMTLPPTAGAVSSSTIGWSPGSYPPAF
jgi:hypothetical protein